MRLAKLKISVCLAFILLASGCGMKTELPEEQITREITPEMIAEYAMIHQMSDLKIAEHYLKHPDYAERHPYVPTEEDIDFYERSFLERMYAYSGDPAERTSLTITQLHARWGSGVRAKIAADQLAKKNELIGQEFTTAERMYFEGRIDEAIEHMEKALEASPESPTMLYDLGVMHMKREDYPNAEECFQNSIKQLKSTGYTNLNIRIHPEVYVGACVNLGLIYKGFGAYNEAIKMLEEAIRFKPDDVDANWNLGVVYWFMGDADKAVPQMRRCIDLDPNNDEAHNVIGLMYYRKKLYAAALDEFRIAVRLHPNQKQYSYNEGLVLARMGRYDEASQAFERAAGLAEGAELRRIFIEQLAANKYRNLYNDGCDAMKGRNLTKAIELFKATLELKPDMVDAHVNLGVCYGMRRDRQNQIRHLGEAARLRPDLPSVRYNLGLAYADAGMYRQALDEFREAIELNPSSKDAHFNLGTVLCKIGDYSSAAVEFEKCLELTPKWFEACLNLGTCYLKTGNKDGAVDQFKTAVQLRPDSAEAHCNLGITYMKLGKLDEASALFRKALKIDPACSEARMMLMELEE